MEPGLVLDLGGATADMLPQVGGKAANLGVLIRAGLPVPPGFCLTTRAYRLATSAAGLEGVLADLRVAASDGPALPALAGRARRLVLAAGMPPEVGDAVRSAYLGLGPDVPVAVRSSATAEDLAYASFAGQQDTYLNVIGVDAVLDAVQRCWASLWTDRAVAYRAANGVDSATVTLAVVVQRMVDAAVAGVMFTANPVTGRRSETVIDASPGLGEAVVSGAVNPDHFVLDGGTGEVLEYRPGTRGISVRPLPGGGTEEVSSESAAAGPCLSGSQLRGLTALGRQVEALYGAPQDLEWAAEPDGRLWLTQARPITTLYPLPEKRADRPGKRAYLCFTLAQGLTRPITPMGLAVFRLVGASVAAAGGIAVPEPLHGPPAHAEAGQRLFLDITPVLRSRAGREIVPRVFDFMEARSAVVVRSLFSDPEFSVLHSSRLALLRRVGGAALRARIPVHLVQAAVRPAAALRRIQRTESRLRAALEAPAGATAADRLNYVQRVLEQELFAAIPAILPAPAAGFALLWAARKVGGGGTTGEDWQRVLRGLSHNVTTEMDLALWRTATEIRRSAPAAAVFRDGTAAGLAERYRAGTLPEAAQAAVARFLQRHGERAVAEIDVGLPRWSEDPTHVLGVLGNYLRLTDPEQAPDRQFESAEKQAEVQVAELAARAAARSRLRGAFVRFALRRTRQLAGLRELPKYWVVLGLAAVRRQLLLVGADLVAAGSIGAAEDIFFLGLAEARRGLDGGDLRPLIAERRASYDLELRRRHIPRLLLSDGTEPEALDTRQQNQDGSLVGSPASAGTATATARVILDPVGARLEPGEILVAPSTDPGWTPLFLTAGGLVMEMGGSNSHGAVVAREYGIPAVVGVADATTRLASGQRITVDGAAGTVTPA